MSNGYRKVEVKDYLKFMFLVWESVPGLSDI